MREKKLILCVNIINIPANSYLCLCVCILINISKQMLYIEFDDLQLGSFAYFFIFI